MIVLLTCIDYTPVTSTTTTTKTNMFYHACCLQNTHTLGTALNVMAATNAANLANPHGRLV